MKPETSQDAPQLGLPFSRDAHALEQMIGRAVGRPVSIILTDNVASMLSVRLRDGRLVVRLHRMFAGADAGVIDEIAGFIFKGKGAMPLFRSFIRDNRGCIGMKAPKRRRLVTMGYHHDLAAIFDEINMDYFGGRIGSRITWSAGTNRRNARKRTLGSYSTRFDTIRISRLLDRRDVPRYYISFVVYHEMLHADMGISEVEGRRAIHTREFRRREKLFALYERALAWERSI